MIRPTTETSMNKPFSFDNGDDLGDFLGGDNTPAPKTLPQDEQLVRIRDQGIGLVPAAKAFQVSCQKCGGSGTWRGTWRSFPCYACKGTGKLSRKTAPATLERAKERRLEQKDAIRTEAAPQIAWLQKKLGQQGLPEGYATMLGDFLARLQNGQALSDKQMAVIAKGQLRDAEYAAKRVQAPQTAAAAAQTVRTAPAMDVSKIVDAFQRAQEAGLKRFTLRFTGAHFQVDKHDLALIWISEGGYGTAKYGRIVGGNFRPGRDATAEVIARIAAIAADPLAAGIAYAQLTSSCSVCGRHLENQDSVDAGIGPVCAGRLNRPGLKFVEVAF
jgi:hypothetical protein